MPAWAGTLEFLTDVGGDLQLDEGCLWGQYEQASTDLGRITTWWIAVIDYDQEESPASENVVDADLEIDTSDDNAAWNGWQPMANGEYSCRYYKLRWTVRSEPGVAQRPKLTKLEVIDFEADSVDHAMVVTSSINTPPANPSAGDIHRITSVAAGVWAGLEDQLALCVETTSNTWRYIIPKHGAEVFDKNAELRSRYTGSSWVAADVVKAGEGHFTILPFSYTAIAPANTWFPIADAVQAVLQGRYDNHAGGGAGPANGDYMTFQAWLSVGTYTVLLWTRTGTDYGIIDIQEGGNVIASFDTYTAAGPTANARLVDTGNAITTAGLREIKAVVNGKNGASTSFKAEIYALTFWRTV